MRELIYTLLELEWESKKTCDFCSNPYGEDNKAVNQIRTRSKLTNKLVDNDVVCEECKEKFENGEMPKCDRCGRLQNKTYISILCRCIRKNENLEEKELPNLPHERESTFAFYERQVNGLREELTTAENTIEEEREAHEDFMRVSEEWGKRQKQELLNRIKELEEENIRLKGLTNQELLKEISELKTQLVQLQQQNGQLTAQVEVKETKK